MRGGRAAIWIRHRPGELKKVVREASAQAACGRFHVLHVEIENAAFA